ncbi:hypothetical protein [Streptomyces sp. TP-A0356]|uniref:hypothetical protein n=1 Tax=Streptomyces sp. TP-A0356 TaxID=1359208 RepID=UPI0006E2AF95|nr:hypothetical protein [Streptomyces sp. TP-A0356]
MQGIPSGELVERLVRLLPEVTPHVDKAAQRHGMRASQVTHWDQVNTHPGTFLSEVLVYPLFKPLMNSTQITLDQEEFLARCFEFIEGLEESPEGELVDTAHFTSWRLCWRAERYSTAPSGSPGRRPGRRSFPC